MIYKRERNRENLARYAEEQEGTLQTRDGLLEYRLTYLPELALVAEEEGVLAGHILLTRASVGGAPVMALAPLSVRPEFQRRGVGTALMEKAHEIARARGEDYVLVLGSEDYYPRAGYRPAEELGAAVPEGIPSANFMALRLREDAEPLSGAVAYAPEFGL